MSNFSHLIFFLFSYFHSLEKAPSGVPVLGYISGFRLSLPCLSLYSLWSGIPQVYLAAH